MQTEHVTFNRLSGGRLRVHAEERDPDRLNIPTPDDRVQDSALGAVRDSLSRGAGGIFARRSDQDRVGVAGGEQGPPVSVEVGSSARTLPLKPSCAIRRPTSKA